MNKLKKGQELRNGTVLSKEFFNKRKEVMAIVYAAREMYPQAPRVEVKIMTKDGGLGWTNENHIIAIGEEIEGDCLVHVVLHELVHTWFKFNGHNEKCPLMKSRYHQNESSEIAWKTFKKYANKACKNI